MKKTLIVILGTILFLGVFGQAFAQTNTPTPTDVSLQQQIDELKSKIASKVAQLNLVEKKGVMGTVSEVSDTQITLTDISGNIINIDVDELTKFYSSSNNTFGMSDIKVGENLGILGLYNKQSQRILAREINQMSAPEKIIYGVITKVDHINYELTIISPDNKQTIAEIQDITKTYFYSGTALEKSGFSKTSQFTTAIITGRPDAQNPDKILASRVVLLPNINLTALLGINTQTPATASATITPKP